jgi:hypothetical protein
MAIETKPTSTNEKSKYFNRMDEAFGLICMSMSLELLFHIESCATPNVIWTTLDGLFGKQDEMRSHMLEIELNSLDPRSFDNILDFFMKFKSFLLQLKGYGVDKSTQEKQMILAILSKLGFEYAVFISTFHIVRFTLEETWKMPSLDLFIESLMHEQDKLVKMGAIKSSKAHALAVHGSNKSNPKTKHKRKGKKDLKQRKDSNFKAFDDSNSRGGKEC